MKFRLREVGRRKVTREVEVTTLENLEAEVHGCLLSRDVSLEPSMLPAPRFDVTVGGFRLVGTVEPLDEPARACVRRMHAKGVDA